MFQEDKQVNLVQYIINPPPLVDNFKFSPNIQFFILTHPFHPWKIIAQETCISNFYLADFSRYSSQIISTQGGVRVWWFLPCFCCNSKCLFTNIRYILYRYIFSSKAPFLHFFKDKSFIKWKFQYLNIHILSRKRRTDKIWTSHTDINIM